jgi:hypothetical protein
LAANDITTWSAVLQGHPMDLSVWEHLFHDYALGRVESVAQENASGECHLRSTRFDGMQDATEVRAVASELIAVMNGAANVLAPGKPVTIGPLISHHVDGGRGRAIAVQGVEARTAVGDLSGGARSREAEAWLSVAEANNSVRDALEHFGRDGWFDLYKTLEVISADLGRRDVIWQRGWGTRAEVNSLAMTANYYRHAREARPVTLLTHDQARELLRRLMQKWVEEKRVGIASP